MENILENLRLKALKTLSNLVFLNLSLFVKWEHNILRLEAMVGINEIIRTKVLSIMHGNTVTTQYLLTII